MGQEVAAAFLDTDELCVTSLPDTKLQPSILAQGIVSRLVHEFYDELVDFLVAKDEPSEDQMFGGIDGLQREPLARTGRCTKTDCE